MPLPAYVYARFSTQEQSKGDSLSRQFKAGQAFVERMGWDYDPARNISDEGRSAFHGSNRAEGSILGHFEDRAREGQFKSGAVLCVESVDRLTRQGHEAAINLLRDLTSNGVTVATWFDNQVYEADKRIDVMQTIGAMIKASLAEEESSKKSKRLTSAWASKIERAQAGDTKAMTKTVPGWLQLDAQGTIVTIPNRVAVLNEMYDHYIAGRGLPFIVKLLNDRKEPNFGRGLHGNKGWSVSTIHKYLTSRTVLGEYEPKKRAEDGHHKIAKGFIIPGYYPQVVDDLKYNQVQVIRKQRTRWGGKNQTSTPNLFSGIATCAECGGPVHMVAQSKVGVTRFSKNLNGTLRPYTEKGNRSYLRCNNALRRYGCTNRKGIRYETLEKGVLDVLWTQAMRGSAFAPDSHVAKLQSSIAEQNRLIDLKRQQLSTMLDNLAMVASRSIAERVEQLEQQIEADKDDLRVTQKQLDAELGSKPAEQDFDELLEARSAMQDTDDEVKEAARAKAHRNLRGLITRMECSAAGPIYVVLGRNQFAWTFDREGNCEGGEPGQGVVYEGPDGEADWHPDMEAA